MCGVCGLATAGSGKWPAPHGNGCWVLTSSGRTVQGVGDGVGEGGQLQVGEEDTLGPGKEWDQLQYCPLNPHPFPGFDLPS